MTIDRRNQSIINKRLAIKSNKNNMNDESKNLTDKIMDANINIANKLWDDIKKRVADDPEFVKKSDNEKIELYQTSEFKDFYVNFPIVSRYMICMGQYSNKAFKRFLIKCKTMHDVKPSIAKKNTEDEWIKRQADYIRYLWESYQRQHFSSTDSQNIWQHAYQTLSQEFKDFKKMHKETEDKLKLNDKYNKTELTKELLNRLSNEDQSLDDDTTKNLLLKLQDKVFTQRKNILIKQINNDVKKII
jgi:hypothetical protein